MSRSKSNNEELAMASPHTKRVVNYWITMIEPLRVKRND